MHKDPPEAMRELRKYLLGDPRQRLSFQGIEEEGSYGL